MPVPGRAKLDNDYRYGFNGMETDPEAKGAWGNQNTTFFRQYDARLGRWMSIDPVTHEFQSPYNAMDGNPVFWADPGGDKVDGWVEGEDGVIYHDKEVNSQEDLDKKGKKGKYLGDKSFEVNEDGSLTRYHEDGTKSQASGYTLKAAEVQGDVQPYLKEEGKEVMKDVLSNPEISRDRKAELYKYYVSTAGYRYNKHPIGGAHLDFMTGAMFGAFGMKGVLRIAQWIAKERNKDKGTQCFAAGTIIKTENGNIAIENIKVGDLVWSFDESLNILELRKVEDLFVSDSAETIYQLIIDNDTVLTTPEHPFNVNDQWILAKDLLIGDTLTSLDSNYRVLKNKQRLDTVITVYNFRVEDNHNYYVTGYGILVHNTNCKEGPRKTKHTDNRHVDRKKYPSKSKYKKGNQVDKLNQRTINSPDKVTQQGRRVLYEKEFGREIGSKGEKINRVVVDTKKQKIVTSFPSKTFK